MYVNAANIFGHFYCYATHLLWNIHKYSHEGKLTFTNDIKKKIKTDMRAMISNWNVECSLESLCRKSHPTHRFWNQTKTLIIALINKRGETRPKRVNGCGGGGQSYLWPSRAKTQWEELRFHLWMSVSSPSPLSMRSSKTFQKTYTGSAPFSPCSPLINNALINMGK